MWAHFGGLLQSNLTTKTGFNRSPADVKLVFDKGVEIGTVEAYTKTVGFYTLAPACPIEKNGRGRERDGRGLLR